MLESKVVMSLWIACTTSLLSYNPKGGIDARTSAWTRVPPVFGNAMTALLAVVAALVIDFKSFAISVGDARAPSIAAPTEVRPGIARATRKEMNRMLIEIRKQRVQDNTYNNRRKMSPFILLNIRNQMTHSYF